MKNGARTFLVFCVITALFIVITFSYISQQTAVPNAQITQKLVGDSKHVEVSHRNSSVSAAGPTATTLQTAGPKATTLQTAGPKATTLQTAGPKATTLQTAGPKATTLQTAGPTATTLQTAGPKATTLQTAVPKATTLQTAGPKATTLQTAGPKATTLQTAGPTATTLQTAGPKATTLQTAGAIATTLQTAGSTTTTLQTATPKPTAVSEGAATTTKAAKQTATTTTNQTSPATRKSPPPPQEKHLTYNKTLPPDVTVVTAYFNLGRFRKSTGTFFDTQLYMSWAGVFKHLRNPFVVYTDSVNISKHFLQMRVGKEGLTKIVLVDRKNLWSFGLLDRIKQIYLTPRYPKIHPNTVVPEYTCAQHAKYEVLQTAVTSNHFNTTYYTWIDVGYFRYSTKRGKEFVIVKPPNFDESRVAMNRVYGVNMDTPPEIIFKRNLVWIGGGFIFGSQYTLPMFIADYRQAVQRYLDMSLSCTDQQVLFAMNTNKEKRIVKQRVPIQPYVPNVPGDPWFFLGYACYRELLQ